MSGGAWIESGDGRQVLRIWFVAVAPNPMMERGGNFLVAVTRLSDGRLEVMLRGRRYVDDRLDRATTDQRVGFKGATKGVGPEAEAEAFVDARRVVVSLNRSVPVEYIDEVEVVAGDVGRALEGRRWAHLERVGRDP